MVDKSVNYRFTTKLKSNYIIDKNYIRVTKIDGDPIENGDLIGFFNSIPLNQYLNILNNIIHERSFQYKDYGGLIFGPLDALPFDNVPYISADMVKITGYDNAIDIRKIELKRLALKFSFAVLEAVTWFDLLEKGIVDKQWVCEVKQWILDNEENILKMQEDV